MADAPTAEQLLHDIAWLRGLARTLAGDRDDADDLAQETWIAAWQRQPDPTRPMRGWLTKVVRDVAAMRHRSDRRRAARDARADESQVVARPDELLAQMRLHQRLVELVIELDEPYRSTVIARFVEGRSSAAIARSLGIPDGTVRKRLHEALTRLRAGLDASNGERGRWAPAALAFAKGGMVVAKSTKLVLVLVAVLLLAGAAIVMLVHSAGRGGGDTAPTSMRSTEARALAGAAPAAPSVTAAGSDARAPRTPVA
ncbi:MAG TPA: RNA polymerase sigma factor, partial [Kofleriaceae bacterium]|nr:RNA polymerase sigma factor [Kofleriaceae bacterium]